MNITKVMSAAVLAGAVLFSATACSAPDTNAGANNSAVATSSPAASVSDTQAVANVARGYYAYVFDINNLNAIKRAGEALNGSTKPTDEQLSNLVLSFPEGFKYFDTSSSALIKNAYDQLYMTATMNTNKMEIMVPVEAVTVKGDTATVNQAKMSVTINGGKIDNSHSSAELMKLKKNATGSWVIVAAPSTGGTK